MFKISDAYKWSGVPERSNNALISRRGRAVTWGGLVTAMIPNRQGFLLAVTRSKGLAQLFEAQLDSSSYAVLSDVRMLDAIVVTGRLSEVGMSRLLLRPARIVTYSRSLQPKPNE